MFALELAHAVSISELDLAIIGEPCENPHLTQVQLAVHPLCVVMPSDHPATVKQVVGMEDFGGVGWMIFPRKANPIIYDRLMEEARLAAVSPVELHHYMSPQESIQLIAENFGVAVVAKGIAEELRGRDIAVRPLSHASLRVNSYLVLRSDQASRLVNDFGRAFLRKVIPMSKLETTTGQLPLGL
jgi:DNA-binding transcriptional LysR family regulator